MRFFIALLTLILTPVVTQAQERTWSLNASDKEAFLVFGVPDTEDVGISFWCEIGTNKTALFINNVIGRIKANQTTTITVGVDSRVFKLKAKAAVDHPGQRPSLEGVMPNNAAMLKSLQLASSMKLTVLGRTDTYPLIDADFIGLARDCAGDALN
ncbi:MAG: hypothetical protein KGO94_03425 [Alphaproteobacteria bacterium]|nr:hypothetical protein [Alphaproteobacteria bacterium]